MITRGGWWPYRDATEDELDAMRDTTHLDFPEESGDINDVEECHEEKD